jgi:uncharacterized NAD-dependent epimerase/dehydratase family protein
MPRSMVLLTWGHSNPRTAKTATGLLRFCPDECVAVFDPDNVGQQAEELLGVGAGTPIIAQLSDVPQADTLVMGIAPPGGKIPEKWRAVILEAMQRGWNVLSGLHDFLGDDPEFAAAAKASGATITDVRKNSFRDIARYPELTPDCLRLHTVGHDCSVGKMLVSLAIARGLRERGRDAKFLATGQTGIMISGDGLPIDCVVADFVSGAAEKLILDSQSHEVVIVEGQGSLVHPSYSAVTLGLLHGCRPHGLILVFEAGRERVGGLDHVTLPSLTAQRQLFESMANIHQSCQTIAVAMNGSKLAPADAKQTAKVVEDELNLPVVDVVRDGPERLLDAVEAFYHGGRWRQ